jgi:CPA2 family monovalent cation:H+ antiporter-2
MEELRLLPSILILISVAVFVVILFKHLKLSPVLGYLVAGALIGDNGLAYVTHENTELLGEFGVVFLLFAIGLELSFERLKAMRKYVFGLGSLQVFMTATVIAGAVAMFSGSNASAIIIGGGLALSSTAIVMRVIEESGSQSTQTGRISLAILLQQDFIVVPLLVIVPILAGKSEVSMIQAVGMSFLKAIIALACIFIAGRLFLRPLFGLISLDKSKSSELFVAATLLIVLSAAWSTEYLGLSLALGAFVAGVLVAETEFRMQAEESIAPFKGLLLGLFFMSVGMTIDVFEMYKDLYQILVFSVSLIVIKALIISGLCMLFGFSRGVALHAGLLLSQGGEFAFILFNLAISNGVIEPHIGKVLLLVVTCTMALTPLLSFLGQKIADMIEDENEPSPLKIMENGTIDLTHHVIIGGFGRVGKMVSIMLEAEGINYIAIDINADVVRTEELNGIPIFRGDIAQLETLTAAGAARTITIILAIDNAVTIKKSLKIISGNFPDISIIVRAPNLKSAPDLYDAGATIIVPEDYETGLQLGGAVLKTAGIGEYEINRLKTQLRVGNYTHADHDEDLFDDEETK